MKVQKTLKLKTLGAQIADVVMGLQGMTQAVIVRSAWVDGGNALHITIEYDEPSPSFGEGEDRSSEDYNWLE